MATSFADGGVGYVGCHERGSGRDRRKWVKGGANDEQKSTDAEGIEVKRLLAIDDRGGAESEESNSNAQCQSVAKAVKDEYTSQRWESSVVHCLHLVVFLWYKQKNKQSNRGGGLGRQAELQSGHLAERVVVCPSV